MGESYSLRMAARIAGIPPATLSFYDGTGFLRPSVRLADGPGRGRGRLYSFMDIVRLRVIREMRERGASLQALRKVQAKLAALKPPRDLADVRLVLLEDGKRGQRKRLLLVENDQLIDILTGQQMFAAFVVHLKPMVEDVRQEIAKLEVA